MSVYTKTLKGKQRAYVEENFGHMYLCEGLNGGRISE